VWLVIKLVYRRKLATGGVVSSAPRVRKSIPGVVLQRDQDILFVLVNNYPLLHHDEKT
jgi:hypothetical protein